MRTACTGPTSTHSRSSWTPLSPGAHCGRGELAVELGLSASATTALLDRLQNAGHLDRVRSSHDRRVVELQMHPKAMDLGREFFSPLGQRMSRAWAGISDQQRETIAEFLRASIDATIQTRNEVERE